MGYIYIYIPSINLAVNTVERLQKVECGMIVYSDDPETFVTDGNTNNAEDGSSRYTQTGQTSGGHGVINLDIVT